MSRVFLSLFVFVFDLSALVFAWVGGFMLRFNFDVPDSFMPALGWGLMLLLPLHAVACHMAGLYRGIWLFASLPDLKRVLRAVALSSLVVGAFFVLFRYGEQLIPRSMLILYPMLLVLYMGGQGRLPDVEGIPLVWWLDRSGQAGGYCRCWTGRCHAGSRTGAKRRLARRLSA